MRKSIWVELECPNCGKEFERIRSEVNRSQRLGRPCYCSLKCAGQVNIKEKVAGRGGWHPDLVRRKDVFSPFKRIFNNIKRRGWDCDLSLSDLKDQWERQKGICPYTGFQLILPESTGDMLRKSIKNVSLDRIDSSKGYMKGNIQFVSLTANLAKNDLSEKEFLEFCEAVANNLPNLRFVV